MNIPRTRSKQSPETEAGSSWANSYTQLTWFEKSQAYRFEEGVMPDTARVSSFLDRNNDGMIDPMEHALGRVGMTDWGDVGLRERDMAMERLWLHDRSNPRAAVSPAPTLKNIPQSVSQGNLVKRPIQKRL